MGRIWTPTSHRQRGLIVMTLVGLLLLYAVGLDQGLLLSVAHGEVAFDQNLIHEAVHDARHAAGFPCH